MDAFVDPVTKLKIKNPLVSSILLERTIKGRNVRTLARVTAAPPTPETTEVDTCGVLVSKSCERKTSRGDPFCVWRLSDLACASQCTITLMLFRDAQQTHADVPLGSVLLLLGASPMEERDSSSGSSGSRGNNTSGVDGPKLSVSCAEPWQVVRLGEALDFGICKGTRKDGLSCSVPVNKSLCGGYCRYHLPRGQSAAAPGLPPGLSTKGKLGALLQARQSSRAIDSSSNKGAFVGGKGAGKGGSHNSMPGVMGKGSGGMVRGGAASGGSQGALLASLIAKAQQGSSSSSSSSTMGSSSSFRNGVAALASSSRFGSHSAAPLHRAATATAASGAPRNGLTGASAAGSRGSGGKSTAVSLRQQQLENMEVPSGGSSAHRQPHRTPPTQPQAQAEHADLKKRPLGSNGGGNHAITAGAGSKGGADPTAKRARTSAAAATAATSAPTTARVAAGRLPIEVGARRKEANVKENAVVLDDVDPLGAFLLDDEDATTRAKASKIMRAPSSSSSSANARTTSTSRDRGASKQSISQRQTSSSSLASSSSTTSSSSSSSSTYADGSCPAAALEPTEQQVVVNDGSYRNGRVAVPAASSVFEIAAAKRVEKLNERFATPVGAAASHPPAAVRGGPAASLSSSSSSSTSSSPSSGPSSSHFDAAAMRAHQQQEAAAAVQLQARRAQEQFSDPFKKHRDECPVAALAAVTGQYPSLGLTPQFLERERLAMASSHAQAAALMRREQQARASTTSASAPGGGTGGERGNGGKDATTVDGGTLRKMLADRKQQQAVQAAQANGAGASLALAMRNSRTTTSTNTSAHPRDQGHALGGAARASTGQVGRGFTVSNAVGNGNAKSTSSSSSSSSNSSLSGLNLPPSLESLINVKSKYAAGAQQEAAENCAATLEWLEAKDSAATERDKITEEKCRAYTCQTCSATTAHVVGACTLAGHSVVAVTAVRRFWACGGCSTRKSTVSPLHGGPGSVRPPKPCRKCAEKGTANAIWKRCGAGQATAPNSGSSSIGLVLSVAESTSYRDLWGSGLDAISDKH